MIRIGDFSQLGQVSIRTLRHYDDLGLLKPAHIDRFTDYRYYTIEQLPRLNRILALKDLGFSLDQIKRLLEDDLPAEQVRGMLLLKQAELEQQLQEEQARLARVAARLRAIEQEGVASPYEVVRKSVPAQTIISMRNVVPTIDDMKHYRCTMLDTLYYFMEKQQIKPVSPEMALYHTTEYKEYDIELEMGVGINRTSTSTLPAGVQIRELPAVSDMASVVHQGSLFDIGQAIVALFTWISNNGYQSNGAYRELHLFGSESDLVVNLNQVVIEMQLPAIRQ